MLSPARISALQITDDELSGFCFGALSDAAERLRPYVWQRAPNALDALKTGRAQYFHRGASAPSPSSRSLP